MSLEDWEPYAAMWADPAVTAFIGGEPRDRALAWTKFGQAAGAFPLLGYGNWAVIDRAGAEFLGVCGFARYERDLPDLEGYPEAGWAFAAASWGRGVASEAVGAALDWADREGLAETRCLIDNPNIASVKVATRHGYAPVADLSGKRVFRRPRPLVESQARA